MFGRMPTSFPSTKIRVSILATCRLPPGATIERTTKAIEAMEAFVLKQPEVYSMVVALWFL
jgi:multidrug efflux pump